MSSLFFHKTSGAQAPAGASSLAACLRRAQIRLYQADARTANEVLEDIRAVRIALDPAFTKFSQELMVFIWRLKQHLVWDPKLARSLACHVHTLVNIG